MGSNPRHELSHRAYLDLVKTTWDAGFEQGIEAAELIAREDIRDEIRRELEDELTGNSACETCRLRRDVAQLKQTVTTLRQEVDELRAARRGHAIRRGQREARDT